MAACLCIVPPNSHVWAINFCHALILFILQVVAKMQCFCFTDFRAELLLMNLCMVAIIAWSSAKIICKIITLRKSSIYLLLMVKNPPTQPNYSYFDTGSVLIELFVTSWIVWKCHLKLWISLLNETLITLYLLLWLFVSVFHLLLFLQWELFSHISLWCIHHPCFWWMPFFNLWAHNYGF